MQSTARQDDITRLVHELRSHQVELELQNEELRLAQAEAEITRARFIQLYDYAPVGYVTLDRRGKVLEANLTATTQLGVARSQLVGKSITHFILPEDQDIFYQYRQELFCTQEPQTCELRLLRRDAEPFWAHFSSTVAKAGERERFLCHLVISDITERKQAEEEQRLLHAEVGHLQKLETLGRLASGVAHDMNNVLGAIVAITETVRSCYKDHRLLDEAMGTVERATTRGRDLVKGLLDFTRKELAIRVPIDCNALVRQEVALLERTLLQKLKLVVDLEEPIPAILGETGLLGSALMNLCVNAADAMPQGGTLTLRTRRQPGNLVEIAVVDTGEGMPPDVLQKAKEPFFTTKPAGKGTGLGLATVLNTIRAHGGSLNIQSEVGQGTTVQILLPCLEAPTEPALPPAPASEPHQALKILVVDDDELLRTTVKSMLRIMGHEVEALEGGRAALEYLDLEPLPDLVMLDLNMPDMTGLETLHHLRVRSPDLPVLIATGYLDPEAEGVVERDPRTLSILKPFSLEELQRKFLEVDAIRV